MIQLNEIAEYRFVGSSLIQVRLHGCQDWHDYSSGPYVDEDLRELMLAGIVHAFPLPAEEPPQQQQMGLLYYGESYESLA
jgi:hypothetical protein